MALRQPSPGCISPLLVHHLPVVSVEMKPNAMDGQGTGQEMDRQWCPFIPPVLSPVRVSPSGLPRLSKNYLGTLGKR